MAQRINKAAFQAALQASGAVTDGEPHVGQVETAIAAYVAADIPPKHDADLIRPGRFDYVHWRSLDLDDIAKLESQMGRGLNALKLLGHGTSHSCGWYTDPKTGKEIERNVPEMLMLMVSEISEGMEAFRKRLMDDHLPNRSGLEVEVSDLLLRIGDLAGYLDLDIAGGAIDKRRYNTIREDHQIEARALGGKAF